MKFPLYNECPNCGHEIESHSEESNSSILGCWENGCHCPLVRPEICHAISIQAAVEVALQRAGVGDFRGPEGDFNIPGSVKRDAL